MSSQSKRYQLQEMYSIGIQQKCISALIILCACLLEKGATQTVTTPATTPAPVVLGNNALTNVENYILLNKRQFSNSIAELDESLSNFRANYAKQVSAIDTQTTLLENRLNEANAALNPLDVLSAQSRSCVQKYRGNIATVDSIKTSLTNCAATATTALTTYLTNAVATRTQLNTYYASSVDQLLAACSRTYPLATAMANYTSCVEAAMRTANTVTTTNLKNFDTQIQVAQCSAESRIREALDCAFAVQYTTIAAIGENTRLINNCIAGLETCPVCPTVPAVTNTACPYIVQVSATDAASTNANVVNPFRNINRDATCVELRISSAAV